MNWNQREMFELMVGVLKEAKEMPAHTVQKTNKLLEAVALGVGVLICKEGYGKDTRKKQ